jgi:hypothetical protein
VWFRKAIGLDGSFSAMACGADRRRLHDEPRLFAYR